VNGVFPPQPPPLPHLNGLVQDEKHLLGQLLVVLPLRAGSRLGDGVVNAQATICMWLHIIGKQQHLCFSRVAVTSHKGGGGMKSEKEQNGKK
jgi:hypothetical protein